MEFNRLGRPFRAGGLVVTTQGVALGWLVVGPLALPTRKTHVAQSMANRWGDGKRHSYTFNLINLVAA
jgi:hypothetical protein